MLFSMRIQLAILILSELNHKGNSQQLGRNLLQTSLYTQIDQACEQEVQGELPRSQEQIIATCDNIDTYNPEIDARFVSNCIREDIIRSSTFAPEGRFPYYVSLQKKIEGIGYEHFCGGTLITHNYVVTAAKCVWELGRVDLRQHNSSTMLKPDTVFLALGPYCRHQAGVQRLPAVQFFVPAGYDGQVKEGDNIMLLKSAKPFNYDGPFPSFQESKQVLYNSQDVILAIGHGVQYNNQLDKIASQVVPLGLAFLKFVSQQECDIQIQQQIPQKIVCYQNLVQDSCFGDYGAPIFSRGPQNSGVSVFDDPSEDIIIGITSFGGVLASPCSLGLPTVYTHVIPQFCFLELDEGAGEAVIASWYYDANSNQCLEFLYGGISGNDNNFSTLQKCERTCMKTN